MASKKIDINTADVEDLESLSGVGHAKAVAIIDHRKVRAAVVGVWNPGECHFCRSR